MKEYSCQFGPYRQLAGVITEPTVAPRRVACVLVSAGLVPKFGPFRLYARLARRLTRDGFLSLRFDLGGIGDSRQEYAGQPLKTRTELEIRAAVDYLTERYELDGVVLGGLCSGAEDSFRYAALDPRVTGVLLIDPFSYKTFGWRWRDFLHRVARRSLRVLGVYRPIVYEPVAPQEGGASGKPLVNYQYMEHAEAGRVLRVLIDRNVRMFFVYTGGTRDSFNYERQFGVMFPGLDFKGLVTVDHFPRTDHTQVLEEDRREIVEAIGERLASSFPTSWKEERAPAPTGPRERVRVAGAVAKS